MRCCSELLFSASLQCVSSLNGREPAQGKANKQQSAEINFQQPQPSSSERKWSREEKATILPTKMEVACQTQPEENKHSIHSK